VPGCYKLPWAFRNHSLLEALGAKDAGSVVPPRYRSQWKSRDGDRNADAIAAYSIALADRLESLLEKHRVVLVLGGDCSILIGNMLALRRRGRYGLIFLDAHSDFRHPGNAEAVGAAAGEDLAIVTGRGDARLINLEGLRPYVRDEDIYLIGVTTDDEYLAELKRAGMSVCDSEQSRKADQDEVAAEALETVERSTEGFWIHLDLDVIDASEMPAVDCPEPGRPSFQVVGKLLRRLLASPQCAGIEVTIYDPDLDTSGVLAGRIVKCLSGAFMTETE
jgi:arginase